MLADYHVHTEFSDDSVYPMEQVVKDGISLGLDELCFTDHVDYGIKRDWDDPQGMLYRKGGVGEPEQMPLANVDYPRYYESFCKLQEKYAEKISLKLYMHDTIWNRTILFYVRTVSGGGTIRVLSGTNT